MVLPISSRAVVMSLPVRGDTTRTAESTQEASTRTGTSGCVVGVREITGPVREHLV